jgi:hypothetical protein
MNDARMTLRSASVRAVVVPLRRPIIAGIGRFDQWPLVLVDLEVADGVVGSSYIAPYRAAALPAVVAELRDLLDGLTAHAVAPGDFFASALKLPMSLGWPVFRPAHSPPSIWPFGMLLPRSQAFRWRGCSAGRLDQYGPTTAMDYGGTRSRRSPLRPRG